MSDLSPLERAVVASIAEREDEIVALASDLVRLDTTAREVGDPPREERALQELLASRLERAGARIDLFEPDVALMAGRPLVPPGLDFAGRPQLIACLPGTGGGRSLVLNGHIDVVPADVRDGWTHPPLEPEVRDGMLYGRGTCDMKGGIAAMTVAAQAVASLGVLAGDLVVATNTDEESSGAGGVALVDRGLRADGAIVTEPTGLDVWTCCRGSSYGIVTIRGRAGHAEITHPAWEKGGAVNPIERLGVVLEALRELRVRWQAEPRFAHAMLGPPDVVPTVVRAGDWAVTIPASCRVSVAALFLPVQVGDDGFGRTVEREIAEWLRMRCAELDPWLAAHPPEIVWQPNAVMPYEIAAGDAVVECALAALGSLGHPQRLGGLDSWFDAATLTTVGAIPAIGLGPSGLGRDGVPVAHAVDEHVPVADLVATAQVLAVSALRFCGTDGDS